MDRSHNTQATCNTELEPCTTDDNTEVKIPVPFVNSPLSPMLNSNKPVSVETDTNNSQMYQDIVEYNRLQSLIKNLPSDLFVDQILIDYSYCSETLDQTRNNVI